MKFYKSIVLVGSLFLVTGCANKGAELNLGNASQHLEPLKENEGNADFNETTITFLKNSWVKWSPLLPFHYFYKLKLIVYYIYLQPKKTVY